MGKAIDTPRLQLIPGNLNLLRAAIQGNLPLNELLQVRIPDCWSEFGNAPLQYALDRLSESEMEHGWWTYFPIHKLDQLLIGSCGYKGQPTPEGTVEIGYEIIPDYRNKGLATELAKGLISHAFNDSRVHRIIAHTLANTNESTSVLGKCGFKKIEDLDDPEDGLVWKWILERQ